MHKEHQSSAVYGMPFISQRGLEEVFIEAVRTVLDVKKAKQANGIFSGSLSHCTKNT